MGHDQHEIRYPLNGLVRADGKFPYQPNIVCPRPERRYIAQIGLKELEEQADRTAPVLQNMLAKWGLETLASKANSHFAHLRSPSAVTNCTLCRNSAVGSAALDWVTAITLTNPAAPIHSPLPRQTIRASGNPVGILRENTAEVTCIDKSPESDVRPQTVCRNELWAPTARQPLLPDRDVIATNAWSKASNVSGRPSLEDEAEERILWPRGVSDYGFGGIGHVIDRMGFNSVPSS